MVVQSVPISPPWKLFILGLQEKNLVINVAEKNLLEIIFSSFKALHYY